MAERRFHHNRARNLALSILGGWFAALCGCGVIPSSAEVSREFLFPDYTCEELAEALDLDIPPDVMDPSDIGLAFEPFTVTSANGANVAGWYIPTAISTTGSPVAPRGVVFVLHANVGPRACYLPWMEVATSNGFAVVAFDYQGFGDSEGQADLATLYDDASAVLDWTLAREELRDADVHLLGISLGTGPAAALARNRPDVITSVAMDGAFDVLAEFNRTADTFGYPVFLVNLFARSAFEWLFETREGLAEVAVPVLFLNAEEDMRSAPSVSREVFDDWGGGKKSFWIFSMLGHVQMVFLAEPDYEALLTSFWNAPNATPMPSTTDESVVTRTGRLLISP